ncbi:HigA family addiction module antitoxin [Microbaculum marinum]|uniref:HigA family addiction module antitoxin n=1 Tax=Microbaculum marinum TaxID=1764581 RepID=A0AAW9RSI8_9HYPH
MHVNNITQQRPPTHPGALLKSTVLPALDMTIADAAKAMKVSRQQLNAVINGSAAMTPAMALRVGKFCGNGPGLWLRMQQALDLWKAEQALATEINEIPTVKAA